MNAQLLNQVLHASFKHKGRDLSGFDCWGLVRHVLSQEFGIEVPSYTENYRTSTDGEEIAALVRGESRAWPKIHVLLAQPGDLVVLRILGRPWHVGIIIDRPRFLHTEHPSGASIERLDSLLWQRRVLGVYRHTPLCTRGATTPLELLP